MNAPTNSPPQWVIQQDPNGIRHAVGGPVDLSILPDGDSKLFMRNGIRNALGGPNRKHVRWLVGELNGVRCYVCISDGQMSVVMTTQDLYP